eukprot:scaffold282580_cov28-Tisochrysis_lutea.AAC.1
MLPRAYGWGYEFGSAMARRNGRGDRRPTPHPHATTRTISSTITCLQHVYFVLSTPLLNCR